ncbi:hypothetical protein F3Y22_tig00110472pilonHSYRG00355 [Hibiscus syriacus]|uniref:Uncharacterized protein n=1 Tax=Hibiscus syriacus TaxID=106335 RepID=A0A6A3AFJ7_HIBSY|nr:hypothetical protein F3Y22_tig00110472pilonHSYRG00355 [Hibiscus syriacus]
MAEAFCLAAAANAVGNMMGDYLVKPIERRIRYLFRFRNIVKELHQQQKKLAIEQSRVQEDVKEAKLQIQTQIIEDYVDEWLTNTKNALKDIESLDGRIEENRRCLRWCPNWCWRYQLSKEIEKKTEDISKLVENSHFDRIGHRAELPGLEFVASKGLVPAKSSTAAFNKIMEALKDDGINIIGVWGMGGVGKTTIVKEVGNNVKGFGPPIMVVVSNFPDIGEMQNKIADGINLKFEKMTVGDRAKELWSRLKDGTFLIILDDLWKDWDGAGHLRNIGIPLVENGKGCKIILTTRRKTVCQSMECQVIVPVDILDDAEAWDLFTMKANLDRSVSSEIVEEAMKVAEECKGLPVAIVTLARALKGTKTRKGWELARKKLQSSRLIEIGNIEEEFDKEDDADRKKNAYWCIKMSYEYLKKETTKICFLLCALYPEDHSIDVEDVVQHAWALELYGKFDSVEDVRTVVSEAIDYLIDSCLLLKDEDKDGGRNVKLHDMVRDVALWIASKEDSGFMIKSRVQLLDESPEPCKAISLLENVAKRFPERLVCPKLEMLLLKNCDVHGIYFQGMQELKVLSLTMPRRYRGPICFHPFPLGKLRALHLENVKDLPFLGNLRTLEILRLRDSGSATLTDDIGMLENLKILDLEKCGFFSGFPRNVIGRLSKLEELYLRDVNLKEESRDILLEINLLTKLKILYLGVSSLHFPEDHFELPRLERYEICINSLSRGSDGSLRTERSLKIKEACHLNLVSQLLENLESLEVRLLEDEYIECLSDKKQKKVSVPMILRKLKQVRILNCRSLKVVFQTDNVKEDAVPLLSKLEHLELRHLPNLSQIWEFPTQCVRLQSLVHLKIWSCPILKSVFSVSLAQSLALLENLEVDYCGELRQIVTELECHEEEISSSINSPNSLCFPKLTTLRIGKCDRLEYIFPTSMAPEGLPQLEILTMDACPLLKQVVRPIEGRTENDILLLQFSKQLLEFSVSGCTLLTDSFVHLEVEKASFKGVQLSAFKGSFSGSKHLHLSAIEDHNLVPDAKADGLNGLTSLGIMGCKHLECLVDTITNNAPASAFTHLEALYTANMDALQTLCRGEPPRGFLENLKVLAVRRCNHFQVLFQMEENQGKPFPNLQSLELDDLPELRWILRSSTHSFSLQSLKVVNIFRCNKLKSLFSPSLIQSLVQLEEIKINNCDGLKTLFAELENGVATESSSSLPPMLLPKLTTLHIHGCGELEYILPVTLAQGLPALAIISVSYCDKLKQVFGMVKEQNAVGQRNTVLLDVLQELRLCSLTNLCCFVPENYVFKAPALEKLNVDECPQLMNFAIDQDKKSLLLTTGGSIAFVDLPFKRDLRLDGWEALESLVHATQVVIGLCTGQPPQDFLQNPKNLIVRSFEQLREVYGNNEFVHNREENQAPPLLSNLEHLSLISLPELRWIVKSPAHPASFQRLTVLWIENCNKMESLFSLSSIQTICSLQELHLVYCNDLKNVFVELGSTDDDQIKSSSILCLQNLKTVEIKQCPSLEYVFPLALAGGLPCLQQICLDDLEKLSGFVATPASGVLDVNGSPGFTNTTIQEESVPLNEFQSSDDVEIESNTLCLPNLQIVDIRRCPRVEYFFELPLAGGLPCLQQVHLAGLENLCGLVAGNNFVEAPVLEILNVSGCPRVTNLAIHKEILKCVPMKELALSIPEFIIDPESCTMVNIPPEQRPPSSEYINLGNFEQLFQLQGGYSISNLEIMTISNVIWLRDIWKGPIQCAINLGSLTIHFCHSLTYIFPMMLIRNLPQLNYLRIEKCEKLEQIIAIDDILTTSSSSQGRPFEKIIEFPRLAEIQLQDLPSLVNMASSSADRSS